jgi:hypothetical protein
MYNTPSFFSSPPYSAITIPQLWFGTSLPQLKVRYHSASTVCDLSAVCFCDFNHVPQLQFCNFGAVPVLSF